VKLEMSTKSDLVGLKLHRSKEGTGTLIATLSFEHEVTADEAKKILGNDFHAMAFSGMRVEDGEEGAREYVFPYEQMTPALVGEIHNLKVCGFELTAVQPSVKRIVPIKRKSAILATTTVDVIIDDSKKKRELISELCLSFGKSVDTNWTASQQSLPLDATDGVAATKSGPWGNGPKIPAQTMQEDIANIAAADGHKVPFLKTM
jgi:hypothetical protein